MNKKYIGGIDGLRTFAVLMVLFYHLGFNFASKGYLGVTLLFVISGYFVAKSLLKEMVKFKKINLIDYYKKKIIRLFPSVALMSVVTVIITAVFNRVLFTKTCKDLLSSLLFYNNWWQIFNDVSYFEKQGAPSPLTHTWSLGVEFQFYILFPLLFIIIFKIERKIRKHLSEHVCTVLAIVSALVMWILFDPTKDVSRIYYGLDTRAFSLLIGAALAIYEARSIKDNKKENYWLREILGFAGLAGILIITFIPMSSDVFLYRGGQLVYSFFVVLVIHAVSIKSSYLGMMLSFKPFKFVGDLSYSIYLWHYPVIILFSGGKKAAWYIIIIEIILTFVLSYLTYRFIETPIRNGIIGDTFKLMNKNPESRKEKRQILKAKRNFILVTRITLLTIVTAILLIIFVPKKEMEDGLAVLKQQEEEINKKIEENKKSDYVNGENKSEIDISGMTDDELLKSKNVMLVGDSVSLATYDDFISTFNENSIFDAAVSRYPTECYGIYSSNVEEYKWDGDALIIALGTNGLFYTTFEALGDYLPEDLDVFVVNIKAPYQEWEVGNNEIIDEFVASRPNTYLVDWYTEGYAHPEYFSEDETHLGGAEGSAGYINCIKKAMIDLYRSKK